MPRALYNQYVVLHLCYLTAQLYRVLINMCHGHSARNTRIFGPIFRCEAPSQQPPRGFYSRCFMMEFSLYVNHTKCAIVECQRKCNFN